MSKPAHDIFEGKTILLTGGTGSFGSAFTRFVLKHHNPRALRVFSRDELKQYHLSREINDPRLRLFLGDVRDKDRLMRACTGVDIIVHAAALKQVLACEYNPFEAIKTNIMGAVNIVDAAIDNGVKRVVAITTDKAVNPVNLYGATKLCSDKVFIHGNSYSGPKSVAFSCVRYGNVLGSRGSVLPLFLKQKTSNTLEITDFEMTRFWISLQDAVAFVISSIRTMVGGEIFVPKIPSLKIVDLARAVAPEATLKEIGVRPGEKLHEVLITEQESRHTLNRPGEYIVLPEWFPSEKKRPYSGSELDSGFSYTSNGNSQWLSSKQIHSMIKDFMGDSSHPF